MKKPRISRCINDKPLVDNTEEELADFIDVHAGIMGLEKLSKGFLIRVVESYLDWVHVIQSAEKEREKIKGALISIKGMIL